MQVQRGREAFALAEAKQIGGSSYGYTAKRYFYDTNEDRHLLEVDVQEASLVSFPANPHAQVLDAKSRHYVPSGYGRIEQLTSTMRTHFAALESQMKRMQSDFPRLPDDDYVGEGELPITDLLNSIQQSLRKD